jgi:DNA topoisomerase IA
MQGCPLEQFTRTIYQQLIEDITYRRADSRIIDQDIKASLRKLLNMALTFIDTLLARNIQGKNSQAHQAEIFYCF